MKIKCPMGEQLQARPITEQDFLNLQSKFNYFKKEKVLDDFLASMIFLLAQRTRRKLVL